MPRSSSCTRLPTFTDLLVVFAAGVADVAKIKIENHAAMIDVDRDDQIRVHVSVVAVDHEVGMLPEIPGAVAFAGGAGRGVRVGGDHGTGLQTVTVFILNGVLLVIENRIQTFVQMRHVVSAVEVVIDKNLPVAV